MSEQFPVPGDLSEGNVEASALIRVESRTFTPEMATALLAHERPNNRPISAAHVHRLARLMREGLWNSRADPIMLDRFGRLIDGQHRLAAAIEASLPIEFIVLSGYQPSVLPVLGTGRSRSAADTLGMRHLTNTRSRAAALRLLISWERSDNPWRYLATNSVSNIEVDVAVERFPGLDEALTRAHQLSAAHIPGGNGFWAALLYRFAEVDDESAGDFTEGLRSGAMLAKDNPILLLHNLLLGHSVRDAGGHLTVSVVHARRSEGVAALAIKAWNAWRAGQSLQQLKWVSTRSVALGEKAEPFPTIEGLPSLDRSEAA